MTLHKVLKYLALVIGVIGLVLLARVVIAGDDAIKNSIDLQGSVLVPIMYLSYFVIAAIILLVAISVIKDLINGNIKKTLLSIAVFAVIVLAGYLLADGVETEMNSGEMLSVTGSQWVGAGLIVFYILAAIAIGAMVLSGVKKLAK
jgi:Na+/alanine symporter